MGNYISCTFITPSTKNSKAARVIFPRGEILEVHESVKAAEVMLECPNFFVVNSQALQIGRRFSPLCADEDIEIGNVYIMFPMRRVNSVVVAADMAVYFMAANSGAKWIAGCGRGEEVAATVEELSSELVEEFEGFPVPEFSYKLGIYRPMKPRLESIQEELDVCSSQFL